MNTLHALTQHQRAMLDYLLTFQARNDMMPPMSQIARDFGHASPTAALETCAALEKKGYLVRNELGRQMFARPVLQAWRENAVKRQTLAGVVERLATP